MTKALFWPVVLACTIAGFGALGAASTLLQRPAVKYQPVGTPATEAQPPPAPPAPTAAPASPTIVVVSYDVFDANDARARRAPDWLAAHAPPGVTSSPALPNDSPTPKAPPARTAGMANGAPSLPRTPKPGPMPEPGARMTPPPAPLVSRPAAGTPAPSQPEADRVVTYRAEAAAIKAGASSFVLVHVTDKNAWVRVGGTRTVQVRIGETVPGLGALQALEAGRARFSNGVLALGADAPKPAGTE